MTKKNIGILTFPTSNSGNIPLSNLVDIVCSISKNTYLITGNDGYTFFKNDSRLNTYEINCMHRKNAHNVLKWILKYITTQIKMSYRIARLSQKADIWIFFIGGDYLLLPMLTAKLLHKKVILVFAGSITESLKSEKSKLYDIISPISKINCALSDRIVLYSPILIEQWKLKVYSNKISIAPKHFLDFNTFKLTRNLSQRENIIGYVGRFSNEKGIINFVESIPHILKRRPDIHFLLIGDGVLKNEIEQYVQKHDLSNKVEMKKWIQHDELPLYLNALKLVVIPSYTEGLPNLMLEAMACGTPVVATSVGSIPDFIKDAESGFIMENNSPDCIAKNVINALEQADLEKVSEKARIVIEQNFTFEKAVERYDNIINNI